MTDKTTCTGVYKTSTVQLNDDALYFGGGSPEGITFRFDDEPAEPLRLATRFEKDLRAVIVKGAEFDRATRARRVRVQISTILRDIKVYDLDMSAAPELLQNIRAGCPTETSASAQGARAPISASPSKCDDAMLDRMLRQGLRRDQIDSICGAR